MVLLAVVVALLAGACGNAREVVAEAGDDAPAATDPTPPPAAGRPGGAEDGLVLSVEQGGGLLPPGEHFRRLPLTAVYEDGTVLSPGAMVEIYPGPALPAVTEGSLTPAEIDELLRAAEQAGLADDIEADVGKPTVADAGTTTITVVVDGETRASSVDALGVGPPWPGISAEQREARERVSGFVDLVSRRVAGAGDGRYVPARFRVLPLAPEPDPDPLVAPDERPWPFPDLVLRQGVCTVVAGEGAAELADALADSTQITRWRTDDGAAFVLAVRPVLPHEPDCPG